MATQQFPIIATSTSGSTVTVAGNNNNRFVYIRNYTNAPGTLTPQTASIYVLFSNAPGAAATLGTKGELEVLPGQDFVFGGNLEPGIAVEQATGFFPNCPVENIYVIATGTTYGCVMTQ